MKISKYLYQFKNKYDIINQSLNHVRIEVPRMNPVLKYRGGKSREIPRFLQYIPDDFDRYIEPFFGGGAVYFYLEPDNAS